MTSDKKDTDQEWFAKIIQLPRPAEVVDFPMKDDNGNPIKVAMRVLTSAESFRCRANAIKDTRQIIGGSDPVSDLEKTEIFQQKLTAELLFNACVDATDLKTKFFRTPKDVMEHLTMDQNGYLLGQYLIVQSQLSPIISEMTDEQLDELISRIQRGASISDLGFFTLGALKLLVMHTISRLSTLQTSNTLSTQPLEQE